MSTIVGNENLRSLWEKLSVARGENLFLAFESCDGSKRSYSYAQFNKLIDRTANALLGFGVRKGSNVAVQLYNCPEYISVVFALAKIGAVSVPLNMQHTLAECAYVLDACDIDTVIAEPDCQYYYLDGPAVDGGAVQCGQGSDEVRYSLPHVLICHSQGNDLYPGAVDFDSLVAKSDEILTYRPDLDALDDAMIIFTSGTTSAPKGCELTHGNMIFGGIFGDWQCGLTSEDRLLTTMPAFHSNFQTAALMPVLTAGASLIYIEKYSARRFWKQVRAYKAPAIQLVAMMARTMMLQPQDSAERDHSVHSVQYYLAISDEEKAAFEERFALRLQNCYGLTESICWVLTDLAYGPCNWPSIGRVGLGYEVKIADESGREVEPGTPGEIMIRGIKGISLMKGYYRKPEITDATIEPDGWMHTGDTGYMDESGWFYFVDRKSNMIKRAGENISSTEVEDVLMRFPGIKEAAVIGVPDPIRDQAVKAFIVFDAGVESTVDEIIAFCRRNLAEFKVPTQMEIVDELPHTSVGKIAKKLLS